MEELNAMVIQILTTFQNAEAFIYLDRRIFQLMISTGFPFSINENYSEREIIKALGIGARGGIRLSRKNNIVVLFFKPHTGRMTLDGGRNVYNDKFDESSGLCYYTGTGQIGDQTFDNPRNRWLRDAKEDGREIHLFVQQQEGGLHKYIGKFEVQDYDSHKKQIDSTGRQRNVILFRLRLLD
jgi:hypothetical protein